MLEILNLTDTLKGYTYDQDKLLTPEETIRRVRDRLGRWTSSSSRTPGASTPAAWISRIPQPSGGGRPPGGAHPQADGQRGHPGPGRGLSPHGVGGAFQLL